MATSLSYLVRNRVLKQVIDDLYSEIESVDTSSSETFDTLTVAGASITDSTGEISFGDDNLTTTGTVDVTGACTLDSGGTGSSFGGALTLGGALTGAASGDFNIDTGTDGIMQLRSNAGTTRIKLNNTGIGFFAATPVAQQSSPSAASGTDAAIIDAIVAALENLGLMA